MIWSSPNNMLVSETVSFLWTRKALCHELWFILVILSCCTIVTRFTLPVCIYAGGLPSYLFFFPSFNNVLFSRIRNKILSQETQSRLYVSPTSTKPRIISKAPRFSSPFHCPCRSHSLVSCSGTYFPLHELSTVKLSSL